MNYELRIKKLTYKIVALLIFFGVLFCKNTLYAAPSVSASVDKARVTLEDVIELSVTVTGTRSTSEPKLPALPEFNIRSIGSSSSIQIVNGQITSSLKYQYRLMPKKEGSYTIGEILLDINGVIHKTSPIKVQVVKVSNVNSKSKGDRSLYLKTVVSNKNPYPNEQITYTFYFFRSVDVRNPSLQLPEFNHLFSKKLGDQKEYRRVLNGKQFLVTEIKHALIPARSGKIIIDPAILQLDVILRSNRRSRADPFSNDDFFSDFFNRNTRRKRKILRSESIELNVLDFPLKDKPINFNDIVGDFNISASLSKDKIKQGDTSTLNIIVSGFGNVGDIKLPDLKLSSNFKVYDDKPEFLEKVSGNKIFAEKIIRKALVPTVGGKLIIPEIKIDYFSIKEKKYKVLKTPSLKLNVIPSVESENLNITKSFTKNSLKKKVEILGSDLLDIHSNLDDFSNQIITKSKFITFLAIFLTPFAIYILLLYFYRKSTLYKTDASLYKTKVAYKNTVRRLKSLMKNESKTDKSEFYNLLSLILREYVGDKLGLEGKAFTASDIEVKLKKEDINSNSISSFCNVIKRCEITQYGANMSLDGKYKLTELIDILNDMDKEF